MECSSVRAPLKWAVKRCGVRRRCPVKAAVQFERALVNPLSHAVHYGESSSNQISYPNNGGKVLI